MRAYQLTLPEVKRLCSVMFLSTTNLNKDDIIQRLLDFLSNPQKRPGRPPVLRRTLSVDYDDLPGIVGSRAVDEENMPTDHQLRQWTRAYVRCFNSDKVTVKHALETASDKFGLDLSSRHTRIKELLVEEL